METSDHRRGRLGRWVETGWPHYLILSLIVANAVTLGLETSDAVVAVAGGWLSAFNVIVLAVFSVEILIKLVAFGPRFFRS